MILTLCYLSPGMDPEEYRTLLIFIGLGSLFFVLPTLGMLSTGFNTIFLCVLEDAEINDGSDEKPYCMSDNLREALCMEGPPSWYYNCWRSNEKSMMISITNGFFVLIFFFFTEICAFVNEITNYFVTFYTYFIFHHNVYFVNIYLCFLILCQILFYTI